MSKGFKKRTPPRGFEPRLQAVCITNYRITPSQIIGGLICRKPVYYPCYTMGAMYCKKRCSFKKIVVNDVLRVVIRVIMFLRC